MESGIVENQVSTEGIAVPSITPSMGEPTSEVPAQETENTAPGVAEHKGVDGEEEEEVNAEAEEPVEPTAPFDEEEEEEESPEPEEEEWVSDEDDTKPRRRGKRYDMSDSEEDDDYGSKRRKVVVITKPIRTKINLGNEPAGMKALRQYTSALRLGPRCFRGLNNIDNVKDREALLISRLHDCGRSWAGEYPTREEIMLAKEETRQKKMEKARQYIIDDEGTRSSRKAAQKARDFVKNLGDENEEDVIDEEVDAEVNLDNEDSKDEE